MIRQHHGAIVSHRFESLCGQNGLVHGVYARHGGVSPAPWQSLNLSASTGDSSENVAKNHLRLYASLGYAPQSAVTSQQVHGNTVAIVTRDQRGARIPACDGLVTNQPDVVLLQRHADCPPIFLYDPKRRVVGVAHSGWRGTLTNIAGEMVHTVCQAFGSKPADLLAAIGPAIGACCYHVGNEVRRAFAEKYAQGHAWLSDGDSGKVYLNLSQAIEAQLRHAGVHQIETANICTACNVSEFYSARAENRLNGCFGAVIALQGA